MINLDRIGKVNDTTVHEYSWFDVVLYHLGIGARWSDLDFVYEDVTEGLKVCPTYAVVTALQPMMKVLDLFNVPLKTILHGEQTIFLERAIPPQGVLLTTAYVPAVYDKGKAASLVLDTETTDETGNVFFRTRASLYCKGLGGFGGDPGPKAQVREIPKGRKADFEVSQKTSENQAVLLGFPEIGIPSILTPWPLLLRVFHVRSSMACAHMGMWAALYYKRCV